MTMSNERVNFNELVKKMKNLITIILMTHYQI